MLSENVKMALFLIVGSIITIFSIPTIIDGIMYYLYTSQGEIVQVHLVIPSILATILILYWLVLGYIIMWE